LANIYILDKIWQRVADEVRNLKDFSECKSRNEPLTSRTGDGTNSYLLICFEKLYQCRQKVRKFGIKH